MNVSSSQPHTSLMSEVFTESILPECQTLESWVAQEVELQLRTLPGEITQSIDKNQAIAYVLKFLPPMGKKTDSQWHWPPEKMGKMLQELITDAATLSLIRLVSSHRA
ncbi:hypothetical protein [Lyngbya sp. PCC 8106]|uniref:hypothetical protein n=1 Tax=Lyngbya sp. (strain PCC 8106) TaxID=313612 RepID=UPI0000EAC805|nr:hypothetical protein [Lyngbya sp. PCC 8106]EAW38856.1 hypothetical protein L8106_15615 [Lyngbya sp. PCC 8106]